MNRQEYEQYQGDFAAGVADLEDGSFSAGFWKCPDCDSDNFDNCDGCRECDKTAEQLQAYSEPSFSWSSCDICGSHLGGDRYTVIACLKGARKAGWTEDHQWQGEVCFDCLYFECYGQLDDMTMLEVTESEEA